MRRLTAGLAATLLVVIQSPADAQQAADAPTAPPSSAPSSPAPTPEVTTTYAGYILGPHDTVMVAVVGRTDYSTQSQVLEDGTISLPLIGSVSAAGLSVLQLKAEIERKLKAGGYFRDPVVAVTVTSVTSQYATLLGDVGTPGLAPLDRQFHLSELIARAGGVRNGADTVTVTLPGGEIREYSLRAIAMNASPDPTVAPGTKIFVQPAPVFYVYGQIGSAGSFPIEPGMTLRNALARAGGPSALGSIKKVKIYRGDKVIKKPDLNMKIQAGDTIHVGERIF